MKFSTKSFLLLAASVALMFCGERASAQSNTSQAVQHVQSGNKVFLEINATQLESELNQLFQSVGSAGSAVQNLSWGDVLGNGANPGMDVNFSSYDITGLGGLTSTGTLAADSLTLAKDAAITGRLSVLDAVSFGDSLTVSGFVEFSDSLEVVKAVTIGETLYVTGVTSLGDSVHVAGNVDLDALFNVDGAATFGSTMTVSGETTLNDSLHVAKSADFAENVEIGQNLYVDSISNLHTNGLSLSANEFAAFSADTIRADFDNLYFTGRFENDPDGRIALEMESDDESPYNEYDGRFYAEHAEAFSGLEFDIDEDEDDADIKIEAVATNNGTEYGRARVYAESEGDHADAGFSVLADDDTDSSTGEFEIDIDSDNGEAEAHIDLRDGWSLRAELEFERSDWDDSYDITLRTDEGDVDVVAGDLLQLTGDRFVTLTADSVIVEGRFGSRFGASFAGNVEIDGETTLNDSLQVNSGANIDGMLAAGSLGAPNLFVDDIAPFNGPDLTLSTTSSTFKMTEDMLGNYPEFASVPEEQLSFLLGNNTGVHSQSVARSTHVGALDTRTASIQSDVALARVQASATQLDWIATTDVASDFVTDSGQISPAAGLGFPIEALETTFLLQNIQEIPRGFLGAGRYALNPEVTNPELAGQGIDQAIWAQDTLLLQGGYNSDDNEMKSTLAMVEEGIAVNANSFYVSGETTLNDSLHVMDSAEFEEDVNIAENLYVDTIKSTSGDEILMLVPGSNFSSKRVVQDDSVLDQIQSDDGTTTVDMDLDTEGFSLLSETKDENYHTSESTVRGHQQRSDRTWTQGSTTGPYEHQNAFATMRTETDTEVPGGRDIETANVLDISSESDRNYIKLESEMLDRRDGYDKSVVELQLSNTIDGDVSRTSFTVDVDDDFHGDATMRLRAKKDVLQSFVEGDLGLLLVDGNDVLYRDDPDQVKQGSVGGNNVFELEVSNRMVELGGLDIEAAKLQGSIADFDLDFNTEARIELVGGPSWIDDTFDPEDDISNVGGDYRTGTQHPGGAVQTLAWERAKWLTGQHWDIMNETGAGTFSMNTSENPTNFVSAVWADSLRIRGGNGYNSSTLQLTNNKTELFSDTLFVSGVIDNEMIANLQAQIELLESALASISDFEAPQAPSLSVPNITALAYNEGTVVFEVVDDGGAAITEAGYEFSTSQDMQPAEVVAFSNPSGTTITAELSNLEELSTYYFRAYAKNLKGTTYADVVTIETPVTPCGLPYSYNGYDYATVAIGSQCWFAENMQSTKNNLGVDYFTNRYAQPNGDGSNVADYGLLYKHDVVMNADICPTGWSVPSSDGWNALFDAVGGASVAGQALRAESLDGSDDYGFAVLGAGRKTTTFQNFGFVGWFRSSSPTTVINFDRNVNGAVTITNGNWNHMYSIRCLRDAEVVSSASAPTVSSAAASDLAETTATLNGTVDADGGDAVTATGFVWGTDASLSGASDASGSATSGSFTASLTGLTGGTTYYFSAYATNGEGTAYGDTLSFTTTPAVPAFTCGTSAVTFDSHDYSTVEIGDQCWFAENLRTTQYADGSAISEVTDNNAWGSTNDGARAAYNNDASNLTTYGYLYNWYAVNSAAGLCPSGWHVATDEEWTTLTTALGGESGAGVKMKSSASDTPSWNGNNTSGFSGLPGGSRNGSSGAFSGGGSWGYWWSASPVGTLAWYRYLGPGIDNVGRNDFSQRSGFSVRCLRDE